MYGRVEQTDWVNSISSFANLGTDEQTDGQGKLFVPNCHFRGGGDILTLKYCKCSGLHAFYQHKFTIWQDMPDKLSNSYCTVELTSNPMNHVGCAIFNV